MRQLDKRTYNGVHYEVVANALRKYYPWLPRWIVYQRKPGTRLWSTFGHYPTKKAAWAAVLQAQPKPFYFYYQPSLFP